MSYMREGKLHRSTLQREGGMVMFIAIFMVLTVANSDVSDTNLFPHFLPLTVGTWAVDGKLTTFLSQFQRKDGGICQRTVSLENH